MSLDGGKKKSTRRQPTQTWGERANSTQKGSGPESDLGHSCCEVTDHFNQKFISSLFYIWGLRNICLYDSLMCTLSAPVCVPATQPARAATMRVEVGGGCEIKSLRDWMGSSVTHLTQSGQPEFGVDYRFSQVLIRQSKAALIPPQIHL